jgi:hypothetical protein
MNPSWTRTGLLGVLSLLLADSAIAQTPQVTGYLINGSTTATISTGGYFTISLTAQNTGAVSSNDAGLTVSFPSLTSTSDGGRVSNHSCPAGFTPFVKPKGQMIYHKDGTQIAASYLMVECAGTWAAGASKTMTLRITPASSGNFLVNYRSAMQTSTGTYVGSPTSGPLDQQGWSVLQRTGIVNTPPTLVVTAPSSNVTVTQGQSVAISWNGTDPDDAATVSLGYDVDSTYDNGNHTWISLTQPEDGTVNWSTTGVTPGTYYIFGMIYDTRVEAHDYASGTVTVQAANTPPTLVVTAPSSNVTVTQGQTVAISWNGTDPDDAATVSLGYDVDSTYDNGNHTWISLTQPEDGTVNWNTAGVTPGTYFIFGMIYDGEAEGHDYASGTVTVQAANTPPTLVVTAPSSNVTVPQGQTVAISWNGTDPDDAATVSLGYDVDSTYDNGNHTWISLTQPEDGTVSWNTTGVTPGTYYIFGMIYDGEAEGHDFASGTVTVQAANTPPTLVMTAPSSNVTVTQGQPVTISWNGTDPDDAATVSIGYDQDSIFDNGNHTWIDLSEPEDGSLSWDTSTVAPGTYYVFGVIYDGIASAHGYAGGTVEVGHAVPTGTTVITHGYQDSDEAPSWPFEMAEAIRTRAGRGQILVFDDVSGELVDCAHPSCDGVQEVGGETIVVFDWADASNEPGEGFSESAGAALMAALVRANQEIPATVTLETLHLIGHSRGTVVNSEAAERLIAAGYPPPEHVTTLDPHDAGAFGNWNDYDVNEEHDYSCSSASPVPGVCSWVGTGFNDNYWRDRDSDCWENVVDPDGIPLWGASNLDFSAIDEFCHSDPHYWYYFTIDTVATSHPDGVQLEADWFGTGTACLDAERTEPLHRAFDGFQFTRIAGGESARCPSSGSKQEVQFNFGLQEGLVNGNFEKPGSGGDDISGWSFHGGGGNDAAEVVNLGNNRLRLRGGEWRQHSWFFVPGNATGLHFCRQVQDAGSGASFSVLLARAGAADRPMFDETLVAESDLECFERPFMPEEKNKAARIVILLSNDGTPVVDVDDVWLAVSALSYALNVSKTGTGSGTVTSNPAGINCGADCSESYASGTVVALTATPAGGSTFGGWSGDADCSDGTVTMSATRSCTATFNTLSYALSVSKTGTGSGTVTSNPAGINCGADCSESYASGTVVALTATPAGGSTFGGWSGDADCSDGSVTMNASRSCTATFDTQAYALTVSRLGTGSGTVTSSPAGISCGADCSELYAPGTVVSLTATPALGSSFAGWSGGCAGIGNCLVAMDADISVAAGFDSGGGLIFASDFETGTTVAWSLAVGWIPGTVGLVGYWPFDVDSNDHSGNGNNGTWSGGGGLSSGRFGNAANFLVDQYYRITTSTTLRSFTELTVAAWFRPTAGHDNEDLFGGGFDGGPSRYGLFILGNPEGGTTFNLYNDSSVPGSVPNPTEPVENYLNNWHHFAATWNGSAVQVYVDGQPTVSGTFTGPLNVPPARSLFINRHEWSGGAGFSSRLQGAIDDLAVFARALSPAEVVALASDANANGVADYWDGSPLVVESSVYHFDEGSGTVASDAVGGHHGVVSGATWTTGHTGAALSFDAAGNSSVAVPRQIYDGLGNTVFAEAWIYPTGYATAPHFAHIFAKRGAYNDWYLALTPAGLLCSGLAGEGGIGSQGVGTCSPNPIPLNQWSKVATSYDGTVMRLYVNGNVVDSESLALVLDWDAPLCPVDDYQTDGCYYGSWIGSNSVYSRTEVAPHNVFHGIIDEVRIGPSGP